MKARDKIKKLEKRVIELETALFNNNSINTIEEINETPTRNIDTLIEPSL